MAQFFDGTFRSLSSYDFGKQQVFTEWGIFTAEDYPLELLTLASSSTGIMPDPYDGYMVIALLFMNVYDLENEDWGHNWDWYSERGYYAYFDYYIDHQHHHNINASRASQPFPGNDIYHKYSLGQYYWIRMKRDSIDGDLYVRAWPEDTEEPTGWSSISSHSAASHEGYIAVGIGSAGNYTGEGPMVANFRLVSLGTKGDPPSLAVKVSFLTSVWGNIRPVKKMYGYADSSAFCRILTPYRAWGSAHSQLNGYLTTVEWICFNPDNINTSKNLEGTADDLAGEPDNPPDPCSWLTAINPEASVVLGVSFPETNRLLYVNGMEISFGLYLRKNLQGGLNPLLQIYLLEDGYEIRRSKKMRAFSHQGQLVYFRFNPSELEDMTGSSIEIIVIGESYGKSQERRTVEFGVVQMCAPFLVE